MSLRMLLCLSGSDHAEQDSHFRLKLILLCQEACSHHFFLHADLVYFLAQSSNFQLDSEALAVPHSIFPFGEGTILHSQLPKLTISVCEQHKYCMSFGNSHFVRRSVRSLFL